MSSEFEKFKENISEEDLQRQSKEMQQNLMTLYLDVVFESQNAAAVAGEQGVNDVRRYKAQTPREEAIIAAKVAAAKKEATATAFSTILPAGYFGIIQLLVDISASMGKTRAEISELLSAATDKQGDGGFTPAPPAVTPPASNYDSIPSKDDNLFGSISDMLRDNKNN